MVSSRGREGLGQLEHNLHLVVRLHSHAVVLARPRLLGHEAHLVAREELLELVLLRKVGDVLHLVVAGLHTVVEDRAAAKERHLLVGLGVVSLLAVPVDALLLGPVIVPAEGLALALGLLGRRHVLRLVALRWVDA